jgi:hypothetical protein
MKRFAVAFISPGSNLVHRIIEAEDQESALRQFFETVNFLSYTKDDAGFNYFKEDFFDGDMPSGSILEV